MKRISQKSKLNLEFQKAVKKPIEIECYQMQEAFEVESMEGLVKGKKGDWLMKGIKGELYVCDREIFEATYNLKSSS
ncbi:PGDYG domain-containing protein [Ulvibacter antarcticus]|uniref:PGDYG protein n=1 Tax=Ulvibacter antarcticus TaxID=442714 RepID=A0A3L9YUT7_9FLAO|nr:PGDYG domain-containing protein [Ulvibacter antarcticus]RMA64283.1 PGDYG protein [Ulvibacter antarcticus]